MRFLSDRGAARARTDEERHESAAITRRNQPAQPLLLQARGGRLPFLWLQAAGGLRSSGRLPLPAA